MARQWDAAASNSFGQADGLESAPNSHLFRIERPGAQWLSYNVQSGEDFAVRLSLAAHKERF
jgi:hypothetical protein